MSRFRFVVVFLMGVFQIGFWELAGPENAKVLNSLLPMDCLPRQIIVESNRLSQIK